MPEPDRLARQVQDQVAALEVAKQFLNLPISVSVTMRGIEITGDIAGAIKLLPPVLRGFLEFYRKTERSYSSNPEGFLKAHNSAIGKAKRSIRYTKRGKAIARAIKRREGFQGDVERYERIVSDQVRLDQLGGELTGDVSAHAPHHWINGLYVPFKPPHYAQAAKK
jgi:hypothetical protein